MEEEELEMLRKHQVNTNNIKNYNLLIIIQFNSFVLIY